MGKSIAIFLMGYILALIFSSHADDGYDYQTHAKSRVTPAANYYAWDDPELMYTMSFNDKSVKVRWKAVKNVRKVCNEESIKNTGKPFKTDILACSMWDDNTCTIITSKKVNMHSAGHELFHCYIHAYHDE
jgi:hypothetical protein